MKVVSIPSLILVVVLLAACATRPDYEFAQSCVTGETQVLMADGTTKAIEAVDVGDHLRGHNGAVNTVIAVERTVLGSRRLYGLNGGTPFVTAEHPFLTEAGWKSIDPAATRREGIGVDVTQLSTEDLVARAPGEGTAADTMAKSDILPVSLGPKREWSRVNILSSISADPDTPLYDLTLDGNHTYFANGYLVHNVNGADGK